MIDFRRAFDLIDHQLLLQKLNTCDMAHAALRWMSSSLDSSFQEVYVNNTLSSPLTVVSGVLQGSILGPVLFILFLDEFILNVSDCDIGFYADDTSLYCSLKSLHDTE